jgi:hypothetical protein
MIKELLEDIKNTDYLQLDYNGWKIYTSKHGLERDLERVKLSPENFEKLLKEMIIFFDRCEKCQDSEFLVYSKKLQQGLIIDLFKKDQKIKIVTILPPKRQLISNKEAWKTQKIFIENYNFYDKDLTEYAILNDGIFRIDKANEWISIDLPIAILEDNKIY